MRWTPRRVRVIGLVLTVALVAALGVLGVRELGPWLIVSDTLVPARAIVVLGGHLPFRAMEAAALYRQGWAPEVWLTRAADLDEAELALRLLGLTRDTEDTLNQKVLTRLEVPARAIRLLAAGEVRNTAEELTLVVAELRSVGGSAAILVTSKPHTRRVRATWRAIAGERPTAIVRYPAGDPYHADRWWRYTGDALDVSREVFGLLNVWAGFPVRPDSSK